MGKEKTALESLRNELLIHLHQHYFHALTARALGLTFNEKEADELVAITFSKMCRWPIPRLTELVAHDNALTYVFLSTTLDNIFKDFLRKKKSRRKSEQVYVERKGSTWIQSPEKELVSKENLQHLQRTYHDTLAKEKKETRVIFYLRTERGIKNNEIAKRLGKSPNTVGTKLRRVRLKIREKILI